MKQSHKGDDKNNSSGSRGSRSSSDSFRYKRHKRRNVRKDATNKYMHKYINMLVCVRERERGMLRLLK